jgi:hypothetical protein
MVANAMRTLMPGKIISKALFDDLEYFEASYQGLTLADQLTYGWEMSYGGPAPDRLSPYLNVGMQPGQLLIGISSNDSAETAQALTSYVDQNSFGGTMFFSVTADSAASLSNISQVAHQQNTVAKPDCLQAGAA